MKTVLLVTTTTVLLAACAAALPTVAAIPSATPQPTIPPTPSPAISPRPTASPFVFPTVPVMALASPTLSALAPSTQPAPTQSHEFDCRLISQSVKNGAKFSPNEEFSIGWDIANTGTAAWDPASVEFTYVGGTRMFQNPVVQLHAAVGPGESIALTADMRAPKNPTKYSTSWALHRGTDYFCTVGLSIFVE